jgi:hemoglobin
MAVLAVGLAACSLGMADGGGQSMAMAPKSATLYDRLGGKPAIEAVTQTFLENVAADARINGRFANTDVPALKAKLVDQICEASGGPCTYAGEDMPTAHAGMSVTEAEFNAMGEDLAKALDIHMVPAAEKNELLGAIGGMKDEIVGL